MTKKTNDTPTEMPKIKVDHAMVKFAQNECANWQNRNCLSGTECKLISGELCGYFERSVKPLLLLKNHK